MSSGIEDKDSTKTEKQYFKSAWSVLVVLIKTRDGMIKREMEHWLGVEQETKCGFG